MTRPRIARAPPNPYPSRKRVPTKRHLVLVNVKVPIRGNEIIYNGKCAFLKGDRKPRTIIVAVYPNNRYDVKLLTNGAKLYCDLSELVPTDGDLRALPSPPSPLSTQPLSWT